MLAAGCDAAFGLADTALVGDNPRILLVDNSATPHDLAGFPLPILLDASRIDYRAIADPSRDLRFYDVASDNDIPFEVDHWDPTGTSIVWVRMPLLPARASDTRLEMYFGTAANGAADSAMMWHDYDLVLHGESFTSSAAPGGTGMPTQVSAIDGALGTAYGFGASSTLALPATVPVLDRWPRFTVEAWLYADYPDSTTLGGEPGFITKSSSIHNGRLFQNSKIPELVEVQLDIVFSNGLVSTDPFAIPLQHWVHLAWAFDGDVLWRYRDGVFEDPNPYGPSTLDCDQAPLTLGRPGGGSLVGGLDEVRVTRAYRDPDWMNAEYLAMTGRMVTFLPPGRR